MSRLRQDVFALLRIREQHPPAAVIPRGADSSDYPRISR